MAVTQDEYDINKYSELIKMDDEIVILRREIVKTTSSKLDAGVITSTDYLTELYAKQQAELNLKSHKIELIKAKIQYKTTLGDM